MIRSACLIFNPVAGQGDSEQDLKTIRSLLETEIKLDIRFTSKEIGAEQLAKDAIQQGVEAVIVSGGDGTISAVVAALVGTKVPLGVISRGTANAFAHALNIPNTIQGACETILTGYTRVVDAAICNGKPMMLMAGVGFEAEAIEQADRRAKDRLGVFAYIWGAVRQLKKIRQFQTKIETEDRIIRVPAAAVTVANAAAYTSIFAQGPTEVVADDGLLDVTIVASPTIPGVVITSYALLRSALGGYPIDRKEVGYLRAKYVRVETDPPQKVVVDGEIIGTTPIEMECIPKGIEVFIPEWEKRPVENLNELPGVEIKMKN